MVIELLVPVAVWFAMVDAHDLPNCNMDLEVLHEQRSCVYNSGFEDSFIMFNYGDSLVTYSPHIGSDETRVLDSSVDDVTYKGHLVRGFIER